MNTKTNNFFKVIALSIDVFESVVADERHTDNKSEALEIAKYFKSKGYTALIMAM